MSMLLECHVEFEYMLESYITIRAIDGYGLSCEFKDQLDDNIGFLFSIDKDNLEVE